MTAPHTVPDTTPVAVSAAVPSTLMEALGIEVTLVTSERVEAMMTVSGRVHQPYEVLHGGASVALAETVAWVPGRSAFR